MPIPPPLPPDEPAGQNPPDGAIIDYWLSTPASAVTIEILDSAGKVIREYASTDSVTPVRDEGNVPAYWIRPRRVPATTAGMHRFVWDLRYAPLPQRIRAYPIAAIDW